MSKTCYIVGAGEHYGLDIAPGEADLLAAADGGYARVVEAGLRPDVVIGDFDSLGKTPDAEQVICLPRVKDVTDTWAAVEWGMEQGATEFRLYGCTGGRVDHTLANVQTAAAIAEKGMHCLLFGKDQIITALGRGTVLFPAGCTGYISVFSFTDSCTVTLQGLRYELEHARLSSRFPLGVSNEFAGTPACVRVEEGTALLVFDRKLYGCIDKPVFMD